MKFRSPTDEPIHLSLLSGHTAVVGPQPTELPAIFHREAIANGCLVEGVAGKDVKPEQTVNRSEVLRKTLIEMIENGDDDEFTANGKPDLNKVRKRAGFGASREEVDAIWDELTKDDAE